MKKRSAIINRVIILVGLICIASVCSSCSKGNKMIFSNDSNCELSIGLKKSVAEKMLNASFENDVWYSLDEQHCCLGFVDGTLAYIEFDNTWRGSKGPQFNEKLSDLITSFGEPADESSEKNRTKIYRLDYVFDNAKIEYYGDGENITGVLCTDVNADITKIEASRDEYFQALIDEQISQMPLIASHGYDERMSLPEEEAKSLRESMGTPYIELAIGTDKTVYEELFKQSFENGKYCKVLEPECVLYFENDSLAAFGIGVTWYWNYGLKAEIGQPMSVALEEYKDPIVQKPSADGKGISELVFELKNGQKIGFKSLTGSQIQYIYIFDGNSNINMYWEE